MRQSAVEPVCFGEFELDPVTGELRKKGLYVRLSPQSSMLLRHLLRKPGSVINRQELKQELWKGSVFVEFDRSLNKAMHELRAALGDPARNPRFIATVGRQGYRFLPVVHEARPAVESLETGPGGCSLAVLPFGCELPDADVDFAARQLASSLTDALANLPGLTILPFAEVRRQYTALIGAQAAGRRLGVKAVVTGELICRGADLHAHVALVCVTHGSQVWGGSFQQLRDQVIASAEDLAHKIAAQLQLAMVAELSSVKKAVSSSRRESLSLLLREPAAQAG
jgi:DNA-binding winged helix-turn-helix (wHTH) protein